MPWHMANEYMMFVVIFVKVWKHRNVLTHKDYSVCTCTNLLKQTSACTLLFLYFLSFCASCVFCNCFFRVRDINPNGILVKATIANIAVWLHWGQWWQIIVLNWSCESTWVWCKGNLKISWRLCILAITKIAMKLGVRPI
jgi:hypothetical protein